MKLVIAEPVNCELSGFNSEVATETREYLSKWFSMLPQTEVAGPVDTAARKAEHKEWKELGRAEYTQHKEAIKGGFVTFRNFTVSREAGQFIMAGLVCTNGLRQFAEGGITPQSEQASYQFEGRCNAMSQHMHSLGIKEEHRREAAALLAGATRAPAGTTGHFDEWAVGLLCKLGQDRLQRTGSWFDGGTRVDSSAFYLASTGRTLSATVAKAWRNSDLGGQFSEAVLHSAIGVLYVQDDIAWFAGYATAEDLVNRRFTRQRAAAVVKYCTGSDAEAAKAADALRMGSLTCDEVYVYPNDVPFGPEYRRMHGNLDSCMSYGLVSYETWDDIYPTDVYSSAYFGAGDNGLVLIECRSGGVPTSRAILNTRTDKYVRWYGEHKDELCVSGTFELEGCSSALRDSWLARVQQDGKIIGPYLDGNYDCVNCDDEDTRLYLYLDGGINMSDTDGVYYVAEQEMQTCCIDGDEYPESEMQYQGNSDTWYHPGNTCNAVTNYYSGDYIHQDDAEAYELEGETVYLRSGDDIPDDWVWVQYRDMFFDGPRDLVVDINGEYQHEDDVVQNKAGEYVLASEYNAEEDADDVEDERECA